MASARSGKEQIETALATLRASAQTWAKVRPDEVISLLEAMLPKIAEQAPQMVDAANLAKGLEAGTSWAAEEWFTSPWAMAHGINAYLISFRRLAADHSPVTTKMISGRGDGRVIVDVFPSTLEEKILFSGFSAQVWMPVGMTIEQVRDRAGALWRGETVKPAVSLVLGAGNVASIVFLDILYRLLCERNVVIVKMSPVNDYLGPYLSAIFEDFVTQGLVRFVYGDGEVGALLASHDQVNQIHLTGSSKTHDLIVWGGQVGQAERKRDNTPVLTKPVTSELGGVSPFIIVPGQWRGADLRYQAEHLLTSKLANAGHNCIASQVLIMDERWPQAEAFLATLRAVASEIGPREPYYPDAKERLFELASGGKTQSIGSGGCQLLDLGVDPMGDSDKLLSEEIFATALAIVRLRSTSTSDFMATATRFANQELPGTLGATVVIDPQTERWHRLELAKVLTNLTYGTIGLNIWSAMSFLLSYTPWGAYPSHTLLDIGSGIGVVHNSYLLADPEKVIVRGPFRPFPRSLSGGEKALAPKLPFFASHHHGWQAGVALVKQATRPSPANLSQTVLAALKG